MKKKYSINMKEFKLKKINHNSSENQRIKGDFVNREVLASVYTLIEGLESYKNGTFFDEVENLYVYECPFCGEQRSHLCDFANEQNTEETTEYFCSVCGKYFDREIESTPQEIFEWYIVTEYLYNKLKAHGEPVWTDDAVYVWGRTCTGQAILLDGVISEICEEIGILK